jgi:hypothetical protein
MLSLLLNNYIGRLAGSRSTYLAITLFLPGWLDCGEKANKKKFGGWYWMDGGDEFYVLLAS